ncbi:sigma-70 family RNA polymerase sigma factor [Apilactobacillus apisilvae]|uniref:Sigma-70 family RNA polymerase sigma factor n=1 Tax=Apilactobacillus apisilvae TaxID=2923364 RepID=A0ABY4PHL2_9LACO|nr:sigma-70 family RNA polymerase sigma factor [Apilactobacillus apisilvae]UQS84939.1 sigma-70 family RNA polymerase sigma factor [Apilactobacillus apisilvae]
MNDCKDLKSGFDYLMTGDHQVIIYGVLKRLNIPRYTPQYDDLMQEGFIIFAKKYRQYNGEDDDKKRLAYLYQGVYWHLLDQLRKASRETQKMEFMADDTQDSWENQIIDEYEFENEYSGNQLLKQLWNMSNKTEKIVIYYRYFERIYNTAEISRLTGIAESTLKKWRKRLQEKIIILENRKKV